MERSNKTDRRWVAIVTGASRGIGAAIARRLASEGLATVLAARTQSDLDAQVQTIRRAGGEACAVCCDMASENDLARLVEETEARFGRLDVLVNSAGIGVFKPLAETTTSEWDRVMAVNVRGPFVLSRMALPLMSAGGSGCIVNMGSVVSVKGYVNQGAYSASKHALLGMTKVLAQEAQASGIRVHIICPGGVDTDLVSSARPDLDQSVLMSADEMADIAWFLIDQRGNAVVDQINVRRLVSSPWFSE